MAMACVALTVIGSMQLSVTASVEARTSLLLRCTSPQVPGPQQPPAKRRLPDTYLESNRSDTPKVALLFLTRGPMPLESIWQAWFQAAEGVLPFAAAQSLCRQDPSGQRLRLACDATTRRDARTPAHSQALFNIYVHAPSGFQGKLFVPPAVREHDSNVS